MGCVRGEGSKAAYEGKAKSQARRSLKNIFEVANSRCEDSGESGANSKKGELKVESILKKSVKPASCGDNPNTKSNSIIASSNFHLCHECFKLPTTYCDQVRGIVCNYQWSGDVEKREIHWIKWATFLLHARVSYCPSYTWKSIMVGRDLMRRDLQWVVGSGFDIRVWGDQWIPTNEIKFLGIPPVGKED
ncbi:hypothetical protein Cgig2_005070 [Carnegiea gigantea]|uniref:Uncharacterized protein n=1 Tax=Carnegiea gigantea TaxID=171969 RepID=A0A9Q1KZW3_9CARY|nr:hypothetical protein Cgig2_005070 [Carnegiea gigantea]